MALGPGRRVPKQDFAQGPGEVGSTLLMKNMSRHIALKEIMLRAAEVIMEARKVAIFPL